MLDALSAAFVDQGDPALAEVVRVWRHATSGDPRESDVRFALTDWVCRTLVPLAMDAADLTIDGRRVRDLPPLTDGDDEVRQCLNTFVDTRALDAETAAYERGEYRALITVLDADDTLLLTCARAVEQAVGSGGGALALASRAIRQLVGPAVVDFDYWRGRSFSVPEGCTDNDADYECDRAERRYRRFFDLEDVVRASFDGVLRSLAQRISAY